MATTGVVNTTLMRVLFNTTGSTYVAFAHGKGGSIQISHDKREITSKDSAGWREYLEGARGLSGSSGALYAEDASQGFNEIRAKILDSTARGLTKLQVTTNVTGDDIMEFDCYIDSTSLEFAEQEDNVTFSFDFTATGPPTISAVA